MKSLKLTVRGIVQKVGFRNTVYRTAKEMKIKGYVKNLDDPDESVEIVAQHSDPKVLEEYIKKIKINDGLIEVHEIIKEEVTEKEHRKFDVVRGSPEEENAERLDVAEIQLKKLTQAVISGDNKLGEKLDNVGVKVEIVGEKVDTLGNKLDSFSTATTDRFDMVDNKYPDPTKKSWIDPYTTN